TRRIQRATYLLSIEDGVTKRNKNGKVLGCGTHPNMGSFHHPSTVPCWVSLLRGDKSLDFQTVLLNTYEL
ncbi:MAG: hypothetical protein U9N46_09895, partial [Euryarchaeota archaeon]|nr:hypothetical protein [Euryarchaeota archaeon]